MASPLETMRQVYMLGGRLRLDGERLVMEAPEPLPASVRQAVREHKSAIMVALGAPFDVVLAGILAEIRPHLSPPLQGLSDEKLLVLVNWNILMAWEKARRSLVGDA